jgi:hypothetical protein
MRTHDVDGDHEPQPGRSSPHRDTEGDLNATLRQLQRSAGNAAVGSLLRGGQDEESPVKAVVRSPGTPLDRDTRAVMESQLGQDFSDVRLHTDSAAAESATSVQAQAYTVDNHIVFGSGRYAPGTPESTRMLAHELTHVVQQRSGPVDGTPAAGGIKVSDPSDRFEREAERTADRVASSAPAPAPVQRQAEEEALEEESVQALSIQREEEQEQEDEEA